MIFKNCGIGDKSTMFHSYFMVYERFSLKIQPENPAGKFIALHPSQGFSRPPRRVPPRLRFSQKYGTILEYCDAPDSSTSSSNPESHRSTISPPILPRREFDDNIR